MGKPLLHTHSIREIRMFDPGGPRIYFAFDPRSGRLDILGVGNKATQAEDLAEVKRYFSALQSQRRN